MKCTKKIFRQVAIVILLASTMTQQLMAAEITDRSLTLSNSIPLQANVNYTFNFSVPSSTIIQSYSAQICTTASGGCTTPAGFDASSATLVSQPTGFGDGSGWSVDTADAGSLRMTNSTNSTAPGAAQAVTFGGVTNPSDTNTTFFARITTYSDASFTTAIDDGVVTASTAEEITLTGEVPPILTFCVGTSIPTDCASATGNSINFGTFSPSATSTGVSQMRANTNAGSGYAITVRGTTMTSGSNTIPALATQTPSSIGSSQFGMNLRDNTTPNVGSDPAGPGIGTYSSNYGTVDQFRFVDNDVVAQASGATDSNTFTVSYIVNIAPFQAAGNYSTTLSYICTATF